MGKKALDRIEGLMKLNEKYNRTDSRGLFTDWLWNGAGQEQSVNPAIQPAYDAFLARVNGGSPQNPNAGQFQHLMEALTQGRNQPTYRRPVPERPDRPLYDQPRP